MQIRRKGSSILPLRSKLVVIAMTRIDDIRKVFERIIKQCQDDEEDMLIYIDELDMMLDSLYQNDFFGTEGQNDPRGDHRVQEWSLTEGNIQQ